MTLTVKLGFGQTLVKLLSANRIAKNDIGVLPKNISSEIIGA